MTKSRVSAALLIGAALTLAFWPQVVRAQAPDLFEPAGPIALRESRAETTVRSRAVTIDFGQLRAVREAVASAGPAGVAQAVSAGGGTDVGTANRPRLTLNLFNDVVVTTIIDHTAPTFGGGYSLSGDIVGEPFGSVTLVVNGAVVFGSASVAGQSYEISSVGEGRYAVMEVERPELECGVLEPHGHDWH